MNSQASIRYESGIFRSFMGTWVAWRRDFIEEEVFFGVSKWASVLRMGPKAIGKQPRELLVYFEGFLVF